MVKRYPQAMDGTGMRGYPAVIGLTHSPARVPAGQWRRTAMDTSRRILLAGMAGFALAPTAGLAAPAPAIDGATVAEERFARMIAAAHAPGVTCARQAERYADMNWRDYVEAARAVLDARV
jgi:hypothetical protein